MSRRRRDEEDPFELINKLLREVMKRFDDEMRRFVKEMEGIPEFGLERYRSMIGKPYVWGFEITIGPDGVPRVKEFGNVRRVGRAPKISEEVEPIVDVIDEEDKVRVVAELPGVEKDKISLKTSGLKLIIKASNHKKYHKEVDLPAEVDISTAKATYRNGVLEVELKKKRPRGEEREIKIE
ncbi:MAG: archaeal heat shock protein Hsp20 [Sulfolobales archaeon]|nr:Hsp20/alpha crystallin family protein [Sulfolobales archaeon]MCX8209222.1 Hsp20/alpha crystallin family protein [Sulfolobales archaeon]MDW8010752.1 archaeal heat shock protein Hsp20 [Sulfolobales archaeon]